MNRKTNKTWELVVRIILGATAGISIGICITLGVSWNIGNGSYYPVTPAAVEFFGSEVAAMTFQVVSCAIYGAVWGWMSTIWTKNWSLLKQTVIHFVCAVAATFPVMWFNFWVPHTGWAVGMFFLVFAGIYVGIWAWLYFEIRHDIASLNHQLSETEEKAKK